MEKGFFMIIRSMLIVFITLILFGCQKEELMPIKRDEKKLYIKSPTVSWEEQKLGGAVHLQAHYRHVLGQGRVKYLNNGTARQGSKKDERTIYEKEAWEIFCRDGRLNRSHWEIINRKGRSNLPSELVNKCQPPAYTYAEYNKAWDKNCEGRILEPSENVIVRKTVYSCGVD